MTDPYRMVLISLVASFLLGALTLFYKFIYPKKKINLFILFILISILPVISIFRPGTYQSGDLTLHSVLLQSFYSNLSQGNLFPQWAGELCGGYGCPAHMFEYPLPYYIGSAFHLIGFGYIDSIKFVLTFSFIISGIGMYLWLKREFNKLSAFVGSLFFLFVPYHLEDLHFRVSVGETLSFAPIPFIFLFLRQFLVKNNKLYLLLTSISVSFLILSHGITLVSIFPIAATYLFYLIKKSNNKVKDFLYVVFSIFFGFLLTAFYWLPAFFEIKYTWYIPPFTFNDFKPLIEYLYSPAIFGFLFQGHNGELRLIVGYFHLLAVFLSCIFLIRNKIIKKHRTLVIHLLVLFFTYFIMMLEFTRPIWNILPMHDTFMFPWRLLIPIGVITSIIAAILTNGSKNVKMAYVVSFLVVVTTILNWGNRTMVPENKNAFYSWIWGYSEYYVPNDPRYLLAYKTRQKIEEQIVMNRPINFLKFNKGSGEIKEIKRENELHSYLVNSTEPSMLLEETNYFLGWNVYVNGTLHKIDYENKDYFGKIMINLPKGYHKIEVKFEDTKIRKIANTISLSSFFSFLLLIPGFYTYLLHKLKYLLTKDSHV